MPGLKDLIRAYPTLSWSDYLHMIVRWRVCPLPRIASFVPGEGIVVDLGCGHGLFAQLLARDCAARRVIGIDLDEDKIAIAQQLTFPNLRFVTGNIADTELPQAAAISILDVLYLLPYQLQEHLLAVCMERLQPGGLIILKETAERPRWKLALTLLEETLAVRILRITATTGSARFYFRSRADWQRLLDRLGFNVETIPLDTGYYHPHVVFVARKSAV